MRKLLYWAVGLIARLHDKIMQLNNAFETNFTDKELHFLVIGLLGMAMLFVIYPLFRYLAKKGWELAIAWIYVFTVVIVITFAIEIGQKVTGTGNMEFADIMFGLVGFLAMFAGFCIIRALSIRLVRLFRKLRSRAQNQSPNTDQNDPRGRQ